MTPDRLVQAAAEAKCDGSPACHFCVRNAQKMLAAAFAALTEPASFYIWRDDETYNVCRLCDGTWRHYAECPWLEIASLCNIPIPEDEMPE